MAPAIRQNLKKMDAQLQAELNAVIRKLWVLPKEVRRYVKQDLREGATLLQSAERGRAPISDRPHSRGKGGKKVVYTPGNLRKSIMVLPLQRAKTSVYVGAKRGGKTDGYYAGFVNFGTKYQRPQRFVEAAEQSAGAAAMNVSIKLIDRRVAAYINKNFNQ